MGQARVTDSSGQVTFRIPCRDYKARADYLSQQFWSSEFTWQDGVVSIPEGTARVRVTQAGAGLAGAPVYVFTAEGSYLGLSATADSGACHCA